MYYIRENDKPSAINKIFKTIEQQSNTLLLPQIKNSKKLAQKTIKMLNKTISKKVVLSKQLQENKQYVEELKIAGIEISDGRWLFEMLIPESLEYILKKQELKPEETIIHISVNDVQENIIQIIKELSANYKSIYIITKQIEKLKKIEEQIFEETGNMIMVMNNKKKSLSKAEIIVNIDFLIEQINQYAIAENAIILDVTGNTQILRKRFEGTVLKNYEITIKNINEYQKEYEYYNLKDIYESEFYKKQSYKYVKEKIKKDQVKIHQLQGMKQIF